MKEQWRFLLNVPQPCSPLIQTGFSVFLRHIICHLRHKRWQYIKACVMKDAVMDRPEFVVYCHVSKANGDHTRAGDMFTIFILNAALWPQCGKPCFFNHCRSPPDLCLGKNFAFLNNTYPTSPDISS
jgi:hypothetical protein